MKYLVKLNSGNAGIKEIETEDYKQVLNYRKRAHRGAQHAQPISEQAACIMHYVYYYELEATPMQKKCGYDVIVRAYDYPVALTDEAFYNFVDEWLPLYVGAIHRHE